MARINVKEKAPAIATHEGGPAKHINTTQQLRRLVLPCLLWEDSFYVDGKTIAEQIADAVKASPASVAAAVAIEAREQFHLRHVPLLVVREMARLHPGTSIVGDTLARVIQRPDEIGEFCAIYWQDAGTSKRNFGKGQPLSAQVKKGLAKALGKFDQYQLAKYAKGGAVRLRDVMFLTQPKPGAGMEEAWKRLADDEIGAANAVSQFGSSTGTWESDLSQAAAGADKAQDKAQVWSVKLRSGTLGYLALLRNLRNMVEADVDLDLIRAGVVAPKGRRPVPAVPLRRGSARGAAARAGDRPGALRHRRRDAAAPRQDRGARRRLGLDGRQDGGEVGAQPHRCCGNAGFDHPRRRAGLHLLGPHCGGAAAPRYGGRRRDQEVAAARQHDARRSRHPHQRARRSRAAHRHHRRAEPRPGAGPDSGAGLHDQRRRLQERP